MASALRAGDGPKPDDRGLAGISLPHGPAGLHRIPEQLLSGLGERAGHQRPSGRRPPEAPLALARLLQQVPARRSDVARPNRYGLAAACLEFWTFRSGEGACHRGGVVRGFAVGGSQADGVRSPGPPGLSGPCHRVGPQDSTRSKAGSPNEGFPIERAARSAGRNPGGEGLWAGGAADRSLSRTRAGPDPIRNEGRESQGAGQPDPRDHHRTDLRGASRVPVQERTELRGHDLLRGRPCRRLHSAEKDRRVARSF